MEDHIKNIEGLLGVFDAMELFNSEIVKIDKGKESWEILKRELIINEIINEIN